ncbi:hypothetical protein [Spongiibacter marinus]|uniref:hypothetical protein n=1 Tax=Spongiibacter marinus TaxID=354246 RepID=UPI000489E98F|nr:hypothetical protein [Spongiibacter marinus]
MNLGWIVGCLVVLLSTFSSAELKAGESGLNQELSAQEVMGLHLGTVKYCLQRGLVKDSSKFWISELENELNPSQSQYGVYSWSEEEFSSFKHYRDRVFMLYEKNPEQLTQGVCDKNIESIVGFYVYLVGVPKATTPINGNSDIANIEESYRSYGFAAKIAAYCADAGMIPRVFKTASEELDDDLMEMEKKGMVSARAVMIFRMAGIKAETAVKQDPGIVNAENCSEVQRLLPEFIKIHQM